MRFSDFKGIPNLTLIPLNGKIPAERGWQERIGNTESELDAWDKHQYNVGIVCGKASGGIEVIDIDSKNQLA